MLTGPTALVRFVTLKDAAPWTSLGQASLVTMVPDVIGKATNAAEYAINDGALPVDCD